MFNKAVADNVAMKNPVRNIKVVRDEEKEPRVLSTEEQSAFFDTCKGTFYDNLLMWQYQQDFAPANYML